jgi:Uma2 family endonuclease
MRYPVNMTTRTRATIADLYALPGNVKAELVQGEIITMPPTGDMPSSAAGTIFVSLYNHSQATQSGRAYTDNVGYVVRLPHRESFSPDVSYHTGPRAEMRFLEGSPIFAVEVRSEGDCGPSAEQAMAQKRADYFACGTLVVWDVDLLSDEVVPSYRTDQPYTPTIFRRNEIADAIPALEAWTLGVNRLFS